MLLESIIIRKWDNGIFPEWRCIQLGISNNNIPANSFTGNHTALKCPLCDSSEPQKPGFPRVSFSPSTRSWSCLCFVLCQFWQSPRRCCTSPTSLLARITLVITFSRLEGNVEGWTFIVKSRNFLKHLRWLGKFFFLFLFFFLVFGFRDWQHNYNLKPQYSCLASRTLGS